MEINYPNEMRDEEVELINKTAVDMNLVDEPLLTPEFMNIAFKELLRHRLSVVRNTM